jgi:hypothetical protein
VGQEMKKLLTKPQHNDFRTRIKFAWFPKTLHFDGKWYRVWLETYKVTEIYNGYAWMGSIGWKFYSAGPLFDEAGR